MKRSLNPISDAQLIVQVNKYIHYQLKPYSTSTLTTSEPKSNKFRKANQPVCLHQVGAMRRSIGSAPRNHRGHVACTVSLSSGKGHETSTHLGKPMRSLFLIEFPPFHFLTREEAGSSSWLRDEFDVSSEQASSMVDRVFWEGSRPAMLVDRGTKRSLQGMFYDLWIEIAG